MPLRSMLARAMLARAMLARAMMARKILARKILARKILARKILAATLPVIGLALVPLRSLAADPGGAPDAAAPRPPVAYADLVDLVEPAPLVVIAQVRKVARLEPERAGTVRPGRTRIYVEARAVGVLRGAVVPAASLSYLADVALDPRGRLPELSGRLVVLVARPVAGQPAMVQLVSPDAQLPWDAPLETRIRAILAALQAADAPPRITGVREASHVPGTLVGEGETQIFLTTADGSPAAISVLHQPDMPPGWSVSFSEVVDASGHPPARDSLAWYRLACFLPTALPAGSNVSATPDDSAQAAADYRLVLGGLGPCGRRRDH